MKIQLKNNYIMVRGVEDEDTTTDSGLIIPKEASQEDQVAKGEVLQNGIGYQFEDKVTREYKKGDIVLFHKVVPIDAELKVDGKLGKVWFIKEKDIIAII